MRCNYIGNNYFIKLAVLNLLSLATERYSRSLKGKIIYFVDTGSVLTIHDLVKQIIRIRKIEDKACIVLVDNNDFIASIPTPDQVSVKMQVCEWVKSVYAVVPNIDEILFACMSVLKLHVLSKAQRRFCIHLQTGKSLMQISTQLSITNKTAYAHRQAITTLYSFSSPAHLIIYMKNEFKKTKIPIQLF